MLFSHLEITLAATQTFEKVILFQGKKMFPELIDYRSVLLDSMLLDIIDKPLGGFILKLLAVGAYMFILCFFYCFSL